MKRCRYSQCREKFEPRFRTTEVCCSDEHAVLYARESSPERKERQRRQVARAAKREYRARTKKLSKFVQEAQAQFNKFIRERDEGKPCICCGRFPKMQDAGLRGHVWDAGHYRSTGAASHLRFNEDNCHRQMATCNRDRSGNAVEYRARLIERIGLARVELLEDDNRTVKWERDELIAIRKEYAAKWRALRAAREARAA